MERVETLVVGAGPVGLFLAAELQRRGRECLLIERACAPSAHSKALALMPGTLELFERAGLAGAFVRESNRVDGVRFVTSRRAAFVPFGSIASTYNFVSILPQWKTQRLLESRLRELGGKVAYGHTLVRLQDRGEGADADIDGTGGVRTVRARYVVGCDGVWSTVREQSGIAFEGACYPGTALLADVRVRTAVPVNEARVHVHRSGIVTMFPMSDTLRRIVVIAPREDLPERAARGWLQERLRSAGYDHAEIQEICWSNAFRVQRRIASRMRRGNVFLAGDSAHTQSPVGGQGMNVGLHDAFSLAEKLVSVQSGRAGAWLLDRYEHERLPVAGAVLRRTDLLTRALAHPHPLLRVTREIAAPALAGLPFVYGPMIRRLALTSKKTARSVHRSPPSKLGSGT